MKRTAILLDENGTEIYRGVPAFMPVRFEREDGKLIDWNMSDVMDSGTPIDYNGVDLGLYDEDDGTPAAPLAGTIRIAWYDVDEEIFLGAFATTPDGGEALMNTAAAKDGYAEAYLLARYEIEQFVALYEALAKERGVPFLVPTDLYDDFEEDGE